MKKNLVFRSKFTVPIYDVVLWIIVAHDPEKVLKRMAKRFAYVADGKGFEAICVRDCEQLGLFFSVDLISESALAHEIKHAEEEVMAFIGNECIKCSEPRSYLIGYLTKRIRALLAKRKIKIQRS